MLFLLYFKFLFLDYMFIKGEVNWLKNKRERVLKIFSRLM